MPGIFLRVRPFQSLPPLRYPVVNQRARNWWDPAHLFPSSKLRTGLPCASCPPESVSGKPWHRYICKRRTTSLLIRPRCFAKIQPPGAFPDILLLGIGFTNSIKDRGACLAGHLAEPCDDARGDRAWFSVSDKAAIGFDHRHDLGSGSRKETFVCHEYIVSREIRLDNFEVEFATNIKQHRGCYPSQRSGGDGRGEDLTVLDDEDVIGSAFGDVSRVVQHQGFVGAGKVRFDPGHDVVQVV